MFGCRALYHDGLEGGRCYHDDPGRTSPASTKVPWELYDVVEPTRPSATTSRPRSPSGSQAMVERWWEEAERNHVLPLDNRPFSEFVFNRPSAVPRPRATYVYWPGSGMVSEESAVNMRNRDHVVTAHVDGDGEGVLLSQGSLLGGWTFFKRGSTLSTSTTSRAGASTASTPRSRSSPVGTRSSSATPRRARAVATASCSWTAPSSGARRVQAGDADPVLAHRRGSVVRARRQPRGVRRLHGSVPLVGCAAPRGGRSGRSTDIDAAAAAEAALDAQ